MPLANEGYVYGEGFRYKKMQKYVGLSGVTQTGSYQFFYIIILKKVFKSFFFFPAMFTINPDLRKEF